MVRKIIERIKNVPEKTTFVIGFSLILFSGLCLYLITFILPMSHWLTVIIEGIIWGFAMLFILSAADKRHLRMRKKKGDIDGNKRTDYSRGRSDL